MIIFAILRLFDNLFYLLVIVDQRSDLFCTVYIIFTFEVVFGIKDFYQLRHHNLVRMYFIQK